VAYLATAFGHEAVIVFFVLSGMLVGGGVCVALRTDRWSARHYILQRATRLYVVLIPGLIMTALWDRLGESGPGVSEYLPARSTLAVFAGNLAFLQGTLVTSFGSNHPLWSLANEACYYAVFPLLLVPIWHRQGWSFAAMGVGLLVLSGLGNRGMPEGFLLWLLGVGVSLCPSWSWMSHRFASVLGLGALVSAVALSRAFLPLGFASDACVAIGTACLLLILRARPGSPRATVATIARGLSGCSYTLYVAHMPLIACAAAWGLPHGRIVPSPRAALEVAGLAMLIFGYSYGLAQVTEARTDVVRGWFGRR
jgi:peptidoglycan/LPS O-acetylase OafA/YrhL